MNEHFASAMRRATAAVRNGQPHQATTIIRSALNLGGTDAAIGRVVQVVEAGVEDAAVVHDGCSASARTVTDNRLPLRL